MYGCLKDIVRINGSNITINICTLAAVSIKFTVSASVALVNECLFQTDFANRDARAAFFARVESGDQVGPPRFPGPGLLAHVMYLLHACTH